MIAGVKLAGLFPVSQTYPSGAGCAACVSYHEIATGGITCAGIAHHTSTAIIIRGGVQLSGAATIKTNTFGEMCIWLLQEQATGAAGEFTELCRGLHGTAGIGSEYLPTLDTGVFCLAAQQFDGLGSFISLPPFDTQGFCVTFWGRIDAFFQQRVFYSRGWDDTWSLTLGTSVLNHYMAQLKTTEAEYLLFSTAMYEQNRWYLFAASWTPGQHLKLYVDGSEVASQAISDRSLPPPQGSYVSRWNSGGSITGAVFDVRVYAEPKDTHWLTAQRNNYCDAGFYAVYPSVMAD